MSWDWQVFLQDTGGGQTYLDWMMSAWGWTLSVAVCALVVALVVGSLMGILRTTPSKALVVHRQRLDRAVPQHPAAGPDLPLVPRASRRSSCRCAACRASCWWSSRSASSPRRASPSRCKAGIQALPQGPALRRPGDGPDAAADLPLRAAADGVSHRHPAADQRVDEHHQELVGGVRGAASPS